MASLQVLVADELQAAVQLYCGDDLRHVYWPKAFRMLAIYVLETLASHPTDWNHFQSFGSGDSFVLDTSSLQKILAELRVSTSTYLKYKHRQWICHVIGTVAQSPESYGMTGYLPNFFTDGGNWPMDVEDKNDLWGSLATKSLRSDVQRYLWNEITRTISVTVDTVCTVSMSDSCLPPLHIEVSSQYKGALLDRFFELSEALEASGCENYLPRDMIWVKPSVDFLAAHASLSKVSEEGCTKQQAPPPAETL